MPSRQGFTLIELLVVIAIIGILSSVVLASLNDARNKGANAAIKSNLSGIRTAAEMYYDGDSDGNGSYGSKLGISCANNMTGMFAVSSISNAISASIDASGATNNQTNHTCITNGSAWVVTVKLKKAEGSNTHWCVDSQGNARPRGGSSAVVQSAGGQLCNS